ncbi:archaeal heat shock protein Hsp14 [Picrophilus oshimae]|uniref:Heat shock protein Hsp20 n=1 Tax=Picrophilus torridus (strain ATCC 700027 / DSM 9790 / JCM 10055 / NBRC 100828 / KAW 2/3) TaxID=1122961 RepID=Q6L128_PICTO|nr:archaeal heat shock protein Hsp14 [Picrophilus oshimae]AAT43324.1 small heat shock protein hsp20 family [Picrophilus oshimae DSM 9789]SMD30368.1 heat shock protein Hsp20 [Picrophilus oshimae DSM 9789]
MYRPLKFYSNEFIKNINDRAQEIISFLYPPMTMYQENGYIYIDLDMPGFKKDNISVTLEKSYVVINASREINKGGTVFENQRPSKVFKRIQLPGEPDKNADVSAKYEDGVLHLSIPAKDVKSIKVE